MRGFLSELIERRVPHASVAFVPVWWLIVEATSWAEGRYGFSPRVTDSLALGLLLLIPSVLVFTWNHGREGEDEWKRSEFVVFGVNLIVAIGLVAWLVPSTPAKATAETPDTAATDPSPEPSPRQAAASQPPQEDRPSPSGPDWKDARCFLLSAAQLPADWPADKRWQALAFSLSLDRFVARYPQTVVRRVFKHYPFEMVRLELSPGDRISTTMLADLASTAHCDFVVSTSLSEATKGALSLELTLRKQDKAMLTTELQGASIVELATLSGEWLAKETGLDGNPELAFADALTTDDQALEKLVLANVAAERADFAGARDLASAALEIDPNFADALFRLVVLEASAGEQKAARKHLQRLTKHAYRIPANERWKVNKVLHELDGSPDLVRRELERQVERFPWDIDARLELAKAQVANQELELALETLKDAHRGHPRNRRTLRRLAVVSVDANESDEALRWAQRLVEVAGDDAKSFDTLGWVLQTRDQNLPAIDAYKEAISLRPDETKYRLRLVGALRAEGRYEEALDHLRRIEGPLDPATQLRLEGQQIAMHMALGQPHAAARVKERRLEQLPPTLPALERVRQLEGMVDTHMHANERDEAEALHLELLRLLGTEPAGKWLRFELETTWLRWTGTPEAIFEHTQRARKAYRKAGFEKNAVHLDLLEIRALLAQNEAAQALVRIDEFVSREPRWEDAILYLRVQAHLQLQQWEQALAAGEAGFSKLRGDGRFSVAKARAQLALEDKTGARATLETVLSVWEQAESDFAPKREAQELLRSIGQGPN